jgi:hypothetical protein
MVAATLVALSGGCKQGAGRPEADSGAPADLGLAGDLAAASDAGAPWTGRSALIALLGSPTNSRVLISIQSQDASCRPITTGACTYYPCKRYVDQATADGGVSPLPQAGTIALTSGALAFSLQPGADGYYAGQSGAAPAWKAGDSISATAPGGTVPGFALQIAAPSATVTFPSPRLTGLGTVDRAKDFTFLWQANDGLEVEAIFQAEPSFATIECIYSGAAGNATVPASQLSLLPAGSGALSLRSISRGTTSAESWQVELRAYYTPANEIVSLTYQ